MRCVRMAVLCLATACAWQGAAAAADLTKPADREWAVNGGDFGNSRYSSLSQINLETVSRLGGAWVRKFEGETSRAIPLVRDGRMFITTRQRVYALDPVTGATAWSYELAKPATMNHNYKGVAVGDGKVFVGLSNSEVIALDEKTGKLLWKSMVGDELPARDYLAADRTGTGAPPAGQVITAAPTYAKGMVIFAMANGDYGIRGRVAAFDGKTGKRLWKFDTIPAPGEAGHETWQQDNDAWKKGGAGVWGTPVVDPDLGLVYFGTGNAVPYYAGELRGGDNLYATSIVALDLKTGKHRWHFQPIHHELWEYDIGVPLVLYDAPRPGGGTVKALAVMRIDGFLFQFERATGKPIIEIEERPVRQSAFNKTSPTQPYPKGADQMVPNCVGDNLGVAPGFERSCYFDPVDINRPNVVIPSNATRLAPTSFSPDTGFFYVTGGVGAQRHRRFQDPWFLGGAGPMPAVKRWGLLTAFDARTAKIAWQKTLPTPAINGSGTLSTAGGLVFRGDANGELQAWNARTGDNVLRFQVGQGVETPIISYEAGGEQYLAYISYDATLRTFKLGGTPQEAPKGRTPDAAVADAGPANLTFGGRVVNTDKVEIGVMVANTPLLGPKQELDEYQFGPVRARVKAGTPVTWTNKGQELHDATALDGSWTTGPIAPGATGSVTFAKPGTFTYIDRQHPFVYGEITVE